MPPIKMLVPLEIDLIDEGQFVENINKALCELQEKLIAHVKKYDLRAAKAKASVKAEIVLVCLDPEQDAYGCVASIKTTLPSAPASATMLMAGETQTGEDCLMCRKSGSAKDTPRQGVFLTENGDRVDTNTGEVLGNESDMAQASNENEA